MTQAETAAEALERILFEIGYGGSFEVRATIIENLRAAGFKIMPREPTKEMVKAAWDECSSGGHDESRATYRAMWDAAP